MPIPSSERRLTRSQVRLGRAELSFTSPALEASSPACEQLAPGEADQASITAERGRRKVLAELAGNDSPIVGLIPGLRDSITCRTPFSDVKSAMATQSCIKKPSALAEELSDTPIGESLLRSQVQLLLQKVEADAPSNHKPAPSLRALCHLHSFTDHSPALKIVAPTPINTPCNIPVPNSGQLLAARIPLTENTFSVQTSVTKTNNPLQGLPGKDRKLLVQSPSDNISPHKHNLQDQADVLGVRNSGISLLVDLNISPDVEALGKHLSCALPKTFESGQITITESVVSGGDHQIMQLSPLISEVLNEAETDILGKKTTRVLQFDSPDKSSATEISSPSMVSVGESFTTSMRELEEDEASQWSVIVNVSSPAAKHEEVDVYGSDSADSAHSICWPESSVHEHLQKNRIGSNKLELLWSMSRKGKPFRSGVIEDEDDDEDEEADSEEGVANNEDGNLKKEQELYSCKLEQCQNLLNGLRVEAEQGERK